MLAMKESAVKVSRVIAVGLGSAALIASAGGPATASPAERAQAKCVSKAEYKAIQKGQGKAKVHQIVQNQKYSGDSTEEMYGTCGWTMNNLAVSAITVRYKGGKVSGKSLVTGSVS